MSQRRISRKGEGYAIGLHSSRRILDASIVQPVIKTTSFTLKEVNRLMLRMKRFLRTHFNVSAMIGQIDNRFGHELELIPVSLWLIALGLVLKQ